MMIIFIDLFGNQRTKHMSDEMHRYLILIFCIVG